MATKKALVGKAPLSLVRTTTGSMVYVYAGQPVPSDIEPDDRKRLLDEEFLVEVEPVEDVVDDAGTGDPGVPQRPRATATKPLWAEFRGLTEEQANDLTLEQLKDDSFMSSYQPAPAA